MTRAAAKNKSRVLSRPGKTLIYLAFLCLCVALHLIRAHIWITYQEPRKLDLDLGRDDTSVLVDTTEGAPRVGFIRVGDEIVKYAGKTAREFTDCERGWGDTAKKKHNSGEPVALIKHPLHPRFFLLIAPILGLLVYFTSVFLPWRFVVKRVLLMIPTMLGISLIAFIIIQMAPGDFTSMYQSKPEFSRESIQKIKEKYGFDKPVYQQYFVWLWRVVRHWDFGESTSSPGSGVFSLIGSRLKATFRLSLLSMVFTWIIAIPLGVYAAIRQYSLGDKVLSVLAFVGMSLPTFFVAFLLLYLATVVDWLPPGGLVSPDYDTFSPFEKVLDYLRHMIIPASVMIISGLAGLMRLMRGNMLEVKRSQYITTARAKGLSEKKVISKHMFRNAINPMITLFGFRLSGLLSGVALTEAVLAYPGLGKLILDAVLSQDIFLVMGSLMMGSFLLLLGNLIADILLAVVDPRIRIDESRFGFSAFVIRTYRKVVHEFKIRPVLASVSVLTFAAMVTLPFIHNMIHPYWTLSILNGLLLAAGALVFIHSFTARSAAAYLTLCILLLVVFDLLYMPFAVFGLSAAAWTIACLIIHHEEQSRTIQERLKKNVLLIVAFALFTTYLLVYLLLPGWFIIPATVVSVPALLYGIASWNRRNRLLELLWSLAAPSAVVLITCSLGAQRASSFGIRSLPLILPATLLSLLPLMACLFFRSLSIYRTFFAELFEREKQTPGVHVRTPFKIAMRRLRRHRLAIVGFWVLAVLYFMALFAGFIAPYRYDSGPEGSFYQPSTKIYLRDKHGWSRPYVLDIRSKYEKAERILSADKTKKHYVRFLARVPGEEYKFLGLFRTSRHLFSVDAPARIYIFGSDWTGRCIFSRICHGARISLTVGFIGVFITFSLGMLVGGISGYFGGRIDTVLMRIVELLLSIPSFYLMLSLRAALPMDMTSTQIYIAIIAILSFLGWPGLCRVVRGMVLSIKEREYVLAAHAMGSSRLKIIVKHVLPNTFSYAIVAATLSVPGYILGESALSLLGLGIQEPQASWGNMLTKAMNPSDLTQYTWIIIPGFFIFIAIMAFNLLGDGLRDAFDPKGLVED